MSSEKRRWRSLALAAFALAASACGRGVDDLELPAAPLAFVRGRVDLASARTVAGGRPLRAALVWGGTPNYLLPCVQHLDSQPVRDACPDPFGFVPGALQAEVELPLDGDGTFAIPIHQLPDASVSVGTSAARISWGSLIVAADSDGSGAFNLLSLEDGVERPNPELADSVIAASFVRWDAPHQRIGFREGGWNENSFFYPTPGCPTPPPGFSTLTAPGVRLTLTEGELPELVSAPGDCFSGSLDQTVELARVSGDEARALACRGFDRSSIRRPNDFRPTFTPEDGITITELCLDKDTFAVIEQGDCSRITVFPLVGCRENPACAKPDWDLTQQPPGWWPCRS